MAHTIKATPRPHVNKDGSRSKAKVDYHVTHRHRRTKRLIGIFTSKRAADDAVDTEKDLTFGGRAG